MKNSLFYCIVIYNEKIDHVLNYNPLRNKENLVIIDNSDDQFIKTYNVDKKYKDYIDMNGNKGLSKAYNKAIDYITKEKQANKKNTWIFLSDDDTTFNKDYICNLEKEIQKNTMIVSGIIRDEKGQLLSPKIINNRGWTKHFIDKEGQYRNVYCINSGLAINLDLLEKAHNYNEKLFLDMVDYELMYRLVNLGLNKITVVKGKACQKFSGTSKTSNFNNDKKRYDVFKKDFSTYCELTSRSKYFKYTCLLKRALNLTLKHKKIMF